MGVGCWGRRRVVGPEPFTTGSDPFLTRPLGSLAEVPGTPEGTRGQGATTVILNNDPDALSPVYGRFLRYKVNLRRLTSRSPRKGFQEGRTHLASVESWGAPRNLGRNQNNPFLQSSPRFWVSVTTLPRRELASDGGRPTSGPSTRVSATGPR